MAGTPIVFAFFHWVWVPGGRPERVPKKGPNAVFHCFFIFRLPGPSALDSKGSLLKTSKALLRSHFGPQSSTDKCRGHPHQIARKGHKGALGISISPRKTWGLANGVSEGLTEGGHRAGYRRAWCCWTRLVTPSRGGWGGAKMERGFRKPTKTNR